MSKFDWSVAANDGLWNSAKIIAHAESNDLDMIDAVRHVKEVAQ